MTPSMHSFESINRGYDEVFKPGQMSLGLVVPVEYYAVGNAPNMAEQVKRVQLAERSGFKAVWLRDIPLNVPSFGDVGQMYDPLTYLAYLAPQTKDIALGVASIALPLHHPLHIATQAATVDQLSGGRLIMGVASGDRPDEYPAMGIDFNERGARFREAFEYVRAAQEDFPHLNTQVFGTLDGRVDVLPKPAGRRIPMLVTGHSRQSLDWNAEHSDGWMYYLRNPNMQRNTILEWREKVSSFGEFDKPFMQAMYIQLHPDPGFRPKPIQLGFRSGIEFLVDFFDLLQEIGVNHTAINLRFNTMGMEHTLDTLAEYLVTRFHQETTIKDTL